MTALAHALAWARRGIHVVPLHGPAKRAGRACSCPRGAACTSPAKHPIARLAPNGLLSASIDEWTLRSWLRDCPDANLGVRCSGKLVVLDIDPRHAGDESLALLEREHGRLPETWRSLTGGGGVHVLFAAPVGMRIRSSTGKLGAGIDVKADGGYIVAPPSWHVSGRPYAWDVDHHPAETPLAEPPEWLVDLLGDHRNAVRMRTAGGGLKKSSEEWQELLAGPIPQGRRNDTAARLIGHLLRRYVNPHVVLALVRAWNAASCKPPLDDAEIERTFESIGVAELSRRAAA